MFTYAFVTGVKNGWLAEETYGPAARKAWIALVGYLTPDGDSARSVRGHRQEERPAVLPGSPARGRRYARAGADVVDGDGAA